MIFSSAATAVGPLSLDSVNVMSVRPETVLDTFCSTMSMSISASATTRKIRAATPAWSGTPVTVTLASDRSCATPVIIACSTGMSSTEPDTIVPGLLVYDERTWIGTP